MSGYSLVPLRDLILESQNGLSKRSGTDGVETPVLRLADITAGKIDESDPRQIRLTAKELAKYALQHGDLVCIRVNGSKALVGRVIQFRANRAWAYCDHFIRLRPNQAIVDHRYLAHYFNSQTVRRHIELNMVSSAGQNTVSQGTMLDIPVPCPGLETQREIVAELEKQFSRLDEAVANLQRVKANLKRYKATVLQSAIDGVLIKSNSVFSEVPLQDLIGRIAQGWSPKCDLNREALPDEWAIITTTAVQPMQYLDNQGKPLPEELTPRPGIEIKNGDFLMTRKGPRKRAGVACLVRTTRHRLMVCDTVYRFRCDESKVQPDYLEIALNAPSVVDAIDRHKAGISESGVSLTHDKLGSVLIPIPPKDAQVSIVAEVDRHLSIVREVEAEIDTNLKRAQALRQATLSKAFAS